MKSRGLTRVRQARNVITVASGLDTYTTTFGATENPISEGSLWRNGLTHGLDWTAPQTASGRAYGTQTSGAGTFDDSVACIPSFNGVSHRVGGTVYKNSVFTGGTHEIEIFLRMTINAHSIVGYECDWSYWGGIWVVKWKGALGSFIQLANFSTSVALNDGDFLEGEIAGNTIEMFLNGVSQGSVTDTVGLSGTAPYTTGSPGIGFYTEQPGNPVGDLAWKDWTAVKTA